MKKITIVGAGQVGAHIASGCIARNLPAEITLIDERQTCETAQVLDLQDAIFFAKNAKIACGDYGDKNVSDSDIFVLTAGVAQKPGETRLQLVEKNTEILQSVLSSLGEMKKEAIVILVTNPVDVLTVKAQKILGLPRTQVFGTGTLLDTSRLRWRISAKLGKDIEECDGYVLGEHGDTSFVAWSSMKDAQDLTEEEKDAMENSVRNAAYEIIKGKGSTHFGIGAATAELIEHIMTPGDTVFPLSVCLEGEYGFSDVAAGVPCTVSEKGIESIVEIDLSEDEKQKFTASVQVLQELL